jgi:iron complex outermembrane receptor protein
VELQAGRDWGVIAVSGAFTALRAVYRDVFPGNRIPGIPAQTAFADLRWRPSEALDAAFEVRHSSRLYVNDANTDSSEGYTIASLRAGAALRVGRTTIRPFLRVDNLFARRYAGSVIVNEGNARYFEPAPERTWLAGCSISL